MAKDTITELTQRCMDLVNTIKYLPWTYKPTLEELSAFEEVRKILAEYQDFRLPK